MNERLHVPAPLNNWDEKEWGANVTEADEFDVKEKTRRPLTVGEDRVKDNFRRYGLLDDQVEFVKGTFDETLPSIQETRGLKKIAVLRVDGDLYASTMDVLKNLYPLVAW